MINLANGREVHSVDALTKQDKLEAFQTEDELIKLFTTQKNSVDDVNRNEYGTRITKRLEAALRIYRTTLKPTTVPTIDNYYAYKQWEASGSEGDPPVVPVTAWHANMLNEDNYSQADRDYLDNIFSQVESLIDTIDNIPPELFNAFNNI